ncbi:hypothetical protein KJ780_01660 [Candidatus Micrarchaeota archaeon]|nr:hypothetical protein [Candidatus Micrarchaeota archaeon]
MLIRKIPHLEAMRAIRDSMKTAIKAFPEVMARRAVEPLAKKEGLSDSETARLIKENQRLFPCRERYSPEMARPDLRGYLFMCEHVWKTEKAENQKRCSDMEKAEIILTAEVKRSGAYIQEQVEWAIDVFVRNGRDPFKLGEFELSLRPTAGGRTTLMLNDRPFRATDIPTLSSHEAEKLLLFLKDTITLKPGVNARTSLMIARKPVFDTLRENFPDLLNKHFPTQRRTRVSVTKDVLSRNQGISGLIVFEDSPNSTADFLAAHYTIESFFAGDKDGLELFREFCKNQAVEPKSASHAQKLIDKFIDSLEPELDGGDIVSEGYLRPITEPIVQNAAFRDMEFSKGFVVTSEEITAIVEEHGLSRKQAELAIVLIIEGLRPLGTNKSIGANYFPFVAAKANVRRYWTRNRMGRITKGDYSRVVQFLSSTSRAKEITQNSASTAILFLMKEGNTASLNIHTQDYNSQSFKAIVDRIIDYIHSIQNGNGG